MTKRNDQTAIGGYEHHFPMTEWTRMEKTSQREAVLEELCQRYWKPLYAYLRCKGYSNEQAKDLVQGFFTDKVLGKEFFSFADRRRGRFRNLLLVALRNYSINISKKEQQRNYQKLDNLTDEPWEDIEPERAFSRAWAAMLLEQVLKALKSEYLRKEKPIYWNLFQDWLLDNENDAGSLPMEILCKKYNIHNPNQAYKIIFRTKARFRQLLREKLQPYVSSEADIDDEIIQFIQTFSEN